MVYWPDDELIPKVQDVQAVAYLDGVKWRIKLPKNFLYSPTVLEDRLYFGYFDDSKVRIAAIDPETGEWLWTYRHPDSYLTSHVAFAEGAAYFCDNSNRVVAVSLADQTVKWTTKPKLKRLVALPVLANGTIYTSGKDKHMYAFDAATGEEKWSFYTKGEIRGPAAVGPDGIVYVGSFDNRLYSIYPDKGKLKWAYRTDGNVIYSAPAIANGIVYFGGNDHYIHALQAETGELKWKFKTRYWIRTFPVAYAGQIYFGSYSYEDKGSECRLYALDALTGDEKWHLPMGDIAGGPHIAENTIFIRTMEGFLHALDLETGAERWRFGEEGQWVSNPAFSDGAIYVACGHQNEAGETAHYLYALETSDRTSP